MYPTYLTFDLLRLANEEYAIFREWSLGEA